MFERIQGEQTWPFGANDRVLQKGMTATVEITLRAAPGSIRVPSIPLETAADNKEMGRVLIRRGGETIAAGKSGV